jgi:hypothetical protein
MIERTVLLLDLTISLTWLTLFSPSLKRRCMGTRISLFSPFHEMRVPVCSKREKEDRRAAALSNACPSSIFRERYHLLGEKETLLD